MAILAPSIHATKWSDANICRRPAAATTATPVQSAITVKTAFAFRERAKTAMLEIPMCASQVPAHRTVDAAPLNRFKARRRATTATHVRQTIYVLWGSAKERRFPAKTATCAPTIRVLKRWVV